MNPPLLPKRLLSAFENFKKLRLRLVEHSDEGVQRDLIGSDGPNKSKDDMESSDDMELLEDKIDALNDDKKALYLSFTGTTTHPVVTTGAPKSKSASPY